jgi:hypothetical protein
MATRKLKLTGICEWAKVFAQNRDMTGFKKTPTAIGTYEKTNGACCIDLILDDANVAALQAAGSAKEPKPDLEGRGLRVKIDRKFDTGRDWDSGAPLVTHADGTPWNFDTDGMIGNGSVVEVMASVYDVPNYGTTGTRLDSVTVLTHVAVEGTAPVVFSADTSKPAANASSPPPAGAELNDEVMF